MTSRKNICGKGLREQLTDYSRCKRKTNSVSFFEQEVALLKKNLSKKTSPNTGKDIIQPSLQSTDFSPGGAGIGGSPVYTPRAASALHLVLRHKVSQQGPSGFEISKTPSVDFICLAKNNSLPCFVMKIFRKTK